jgi:hypothetical protein
MDALLMNPGTGPIADRVTRRNADRNIRQLLTDIGVTGAKIARAGSVDDTGRYPYRVSFKQKRARIDMPGLVLECVRFVENPGQDVWRFPRLYVDGDSWLWMFAANNLARAFALPEPYPEREPAAAAPPSRNAPPRDDQIAHASGVNYRSRVDAGKVAPLNASQLADMPEVFALGYRGTPLTNGGPESAAS